MGTTSKRTLPIKRVILALGMIGLATAAMFFGLSSHEWSSGDEGTASVDSGMVYSIELPRAEPIMPLGPNRDQFEAYCVQCHSPRLVANQPRFSEKKWSDIVHKMVVAYGVKMTAEKEKEVVAYLDHILGLKVNANPSDAPPAAVIPDANRR